MKIKFTPTYLMIKRHKVTGLLYFCKTTRKNPTCYLGSGDYWRDHLQKHGKEVEMLWCELFDDEEKLTDFALTFSEHFNIVNERDATGKKIWANLIPENGLDGRLSGIPFTKEHCDKISASKKVPGYKQNPPPDTTGTKRTMKFREESTIRQLKSHIKNYDLTDLRNFKEHLKFLFVEKNMCLHEIATHLNINISAVSNHLPLSKEERKIVRSARIKIPTRDVNTGRFLAKENTCQT